MFGFCVFSSYAFNLEARQCLNLETSGRTIIRGGRACARQQKDRVGEVPRAIPGMSMILLWQLLTLIKAFDIGTSRLF
jgi:hypothetical protein